ncbi:kinase-like domain-containing protein [Flagelloscypha sp. PMI_526]|nr:kinase-like domain-containing protein [Flagelloscypha sp. PMI_526]
MPAEPPKKIGGEYGEIRASIDLDSLNSYLEKATTRIRGPVSVKQFKFGQSNPTYFLTDSNGVKFVLRKKPAGKLISKTAHQVEREHAALSAITSYNRLPSTAPEKRVPVPEPILLCEDESIVGTPFYVMEFIEGRIFTDSKLPEVSAQDRKEWYVSTWVSSLPMHYYLNFLPCSWLSAVRALANLGSISPDEVGLSKFGPHTAYFSRQIKSMSKVSEAQAQVEDIESKKLVGKIPYFQQLLDWYRRNLPDENVMGTRIVHGDYKMDNLIFHPSENRVIGILDWELCTLGSPLADLANLTQPWAIDPVDFKAPPEITGASPMNAFKNTSNAPLPLEDLEREYAKGTNQPYPVQGIIFARSWMLFRLAVIAQGIAARHARRQASSELAWVYVHMFPIIGLFARRLVEEQGIKFVEEAKL